MVSSKNKREYRKRYYLEHRKERLEYAKRYRLEHRKERREYAKRYRMEHPQARKAVNKYQKSKRGREVLREYQKSIRGRYNAFAANLRYSYGIEVFDWAALYNNQNGACAACDRRLLFDRNTHVDHDHKTGQVRGLLCRRCNFVLGLYKDDARQLRALATYVSQQDEGDETCKLHPTRWTLKTSPRTREV